MKKFKKGLVYTIATLLLIIVIIISYVTVALPNVGDPENIKVAITPKRIARGDYLANHVAVCTDCHSRRDWTKFAAPLKPGTTGGGGELFDARVGFPGNVHVPNITPYSLSSWTDGEIFRAITCGVRKNGNAIFPLMPWPYYSKMSREDVYSLIAYLRSLKPIKAAYRKSTLDFPLNILVHTMPQKAELSQMPSPADTVKYGEYMARSAACMECHTKVDKGKAIPGMEFAGSHEFTINGNTVRSANITPDKATGIGLWTQAAFLQRFKLFKDPSKAQSVATNEFQTIMPWYAYSGLSDNDLKAIYAYLRTVKPIKNNVVKFQVNSIASTKSASQ